MSEGRFRHAKILAFSGTLLAISTGLVSYSPTLYRMFCNLTGYGGTVQRAVAKQAVAPISNEKITVSFDANVAPGLSWEFRPEQHKVETRIGEPTKVYYYARNNSDETQIAQATYNVTPYQAAPYFFKIECFCFTQEKLGPGESARMPLVFYVDEEMLNDTDAKGAHDITLSYTFFRQKNLTAKEVAAARDLKAGSEEKDSKLKSAASAQFENDAPRQ